MPASEKTFVMVKPDGVTRGLIGEIIRRLEQRGLKIVALKMFQPTREQIDGHYPKDEVWINRLGEKTKSTYEKYGYDMEKELGSSDTRVVGGYIREWILDFMTFAPVVTMVVEGLHSVDMVRKLVGQTIPSMADLGSIRGDYSIDSPILANLERRALSNIVHASETIEEAKHEISYWFSDEAVVSYPRSDEGALPQKNTQNPKSE
jgi:nucleoside-diphosphate kinase